MDDVTAAQAYGWDWLEAFAFSDVVNRGQTTHTGKRLTPCIRYAFIATSLNRRFGDASWSEWAFLFRVGHGAYPRRGWGGWRPG